MPPESRYSLSEAKEAAAATLFDVVVPLSSFPKNVLKTRYSPDVLSPASGVQYQQKISKRRGLHEGWSGKRWMEHLKKDFVQTSRVFNGTLVDHR